MTGGKWVPDTAEGFTVVGKTLLEILWDELISDIDSLMQEPDQIWMKGHAAGITWCIAILTHAPNDPDVDAIKAEAMERWGRDNA